MSELVSNFWWLWLLLTATSYGLMLISTAQQRKLEDQEIVKNLPTEPDEEYDRLWQRYYNQIVFSKLLVITNFSVCVCATIINILSRDISIWRGLLIISFFLFSGWGFYLVGKWRKHNQDFRANLPVLDELLPPLPDQFRRHHQKNKINYSFIYCLSLLNSIGFFITANW